MLLGLIILLSNAKTFINIWVWLKCQNAFWSHCRIANCGIPLCYMKDPQRKETVMSPARLETTGCFHQPFEMVSVNCFSDWQNECSISRLIERESSSLPPPRCEIRTLLSRRHTSISKFTATHGLNSLRGSDVPCLVSCKQTGCCFSEGSCWEVLVAAVGWRVQGKK